MKNKDFFDWRNELGNIFQVRVTPKSSSNRIKIQHQKDGSRFIKVYVTEIAENGRANKAMLELLAKELGLAKSSLIITHGLTSRNKTIKNLAKI